MDRFLVLFSYFYNFYMLLAKPNHDHTILVFLVFHLNTLKQYNQVMVNVWNDHNFTHWLI